VVNWLLFQVKDVKDGTLSPEIVKLVKRSAKIYTNEWLGYKSLQRVYDHTFIKHNEGEYVNGRIHTNTIEGFWSLFKEV
jgi:hypothetical protein